MQTNLAAREWDEWLEKLAVFRKTFGHCRVPPNWSGIPGLVKWVARQRNEFHRLPLEKLEQLYRFGFDFGGGRYWLSRFFELVDFKRDHGHCNVPIDWPNNPQLGRWLSGQRLRKDRLPVQRRKLLEDLGVDWAPLQSAWNKRFAELRAFKQTYGHCNVPAHWPENPPLALWVANQRHRRGRSSALQKRLLNRMSFDWHPAETIWKTHLRELKQFKRRCGHCNLPARWSENPALATWVGELRRRGKGKVSARWKRRLNALGFEWAPARLQWWETRFRELEAFKKQFGHCNVPKEWAANPGLGNWVSTQRTQCAHLSPQRRRRLERLGFRWQVIPMSPRKTWEDRFQELVAFHKRFGHCAVPSTWPENQPFAEWVKRQRGRDKAKLTSQQRRRLDKLGFLWTVREDNWAQRFAELVAFNKQHGHSEVPRDWPENPELGRWVLHQRYRKHTLSAGRIKKLFRLGFRWPSQGKQNLHANTLESAVVQFVEAANVSDGCSLEDRHREIRRTSLR